MSCQPCREGRHSQCAGDFNSICSCHWCKRWADTHGPFSTPENTTSEVPDGR